MEHGEHHANRCSSAAIGRKATPEAVTRAAVQAEELGLADVWVSEHVILPKDAPYPPSPAFLEPILTLAWAAAATKRVRLGTSVIVLPMIIPYRSPGSPRCRH